MPLVFLAALCLAVSALAAPDKPNILFILVDGSRCHRILSSCRTLSSPHRQNHSSLLTIYLGPD
jgi:hypothetical protein